MSDETNNAKHTDLKTLAKNYKSLRAKFKELDKKCQNLDKEFGLALEAASMALEATLGAQQELLAASVGETVAEFEADERCHNCGGPKNSVDDEDGCDHEHDDMFNPADTDEDDE